MLLSTALAFHSSDKVLVSSVCAVAHDGYMFSALTQHSKQAINRCIGLEHCQGVGTAFQHADAVNGGNAQAVLAIFTTFEFLVDSHNAAEGKERADLPAQLALRSQPLLGTACELLSNCPLAFRNRDRDRENTSQVQVTEQVSRLKRGAELLDEGPENHLVAAWRNARTQVIRGSVVLFAKNCTPLHVRGSLEEVGGRW